MLACRVDGEAGGEASDQAGGCQKAERWRASSPKRIGDLHTRGARI
jgi:hypothetical protein